MTILKPIILFILGSAVLPIVAGIPLAVLRRYEDKPTPLPRPLFVVGTILVSSGIYIGLLFVGTTAIKNLPGAIDCRIMLVAFIAGLVTWQYGVPLFMKNRK